MTNNTGLVVLDRDGVINEESSEYIKSPDEWRPLSGSLEAIAALTQAGFRIAVVSNQSGLGRGLFSQADFEATQARMLGAIEALGGKIAGCYHCPHRPDEDCACRKPRTGMLEQLAEDLDTELSGVPLVGDKPADLELARRAGARPILVLTGYGRKTLEKDGAVEHYPDLAAAARALIEEKAG